MTYSDVESRTGALFCQMCSDFVWDPTLEELRVRKIGTGSFSSKSNMSLYHHRVLLWQASIRRSLALAAALQCLHHKYLYTFVLSCIALSIIQLCQRR